MPWLHPTHIALSVSGGVFEIIGVFLMSSRYINVSFGFAMLGLISSLWRGKTARDVANTERLTVENVLASLQGLSLIGIGFVLSTAANILAAF